MLGLQGPWGVYLLYQDMLYQAILLKYLKVNYTVGGQECRVNI